MDQNSKLQLLKLYFHQVNFSVKKPFFSVKNLYIYIQNRNSVLSGSIKTSEFRTQSLNFMCRNTYLYLQHEWIWLFLEWGIWKKDPYSEAVKNTGWSNRNDKERTWRLLICHYTDMWLAIFCLQKTDLLSFSSCYSWRIHMRFGKGA